ncbi:hypothetical protein KM043_002391 [Ampulex compressa]|nr:hypothetical protein KM043_002391 [Ampulex compressa]
MEVSKNSRGGVHDYCRSCDFQWLNDSDSHPGNVTPFRFAGGSSCTAGGLLSQGLRLMHQGLHPYESVTMRRMLPGSRSLARASTPRGECNFFIVFNFFPHRCYRILSEKRQLDIEEAD